jgi:hypothetical protein
MGGGILAFRLNRDMRDHDAVFRPQLFDLPLAFVEETIEIMDKKHPLAWVIRRAAPAEQDVISTLGRGEALLQTSFRNDFETGKITALNRRCVHRRSGYERPPLLAIVTGFEILPSSHRKISAVRRHPIAVQGNPFRRKLFTGSAPACRLRASLIACHVSAGFERRLELTSHCCEAIRTSARCIHAVAAGKQFHPDVPGRMKNVGSSASMKKEVTDR